MGCLGLARMHIPTEEGTTSGGEQEVVSPRKKGRLTFLCAHFEVQVLVGLLAPIVTGEGGLVEADSDCLFLVALA